MKKIIYISLLCTLIFSCGTDLDQEPLIQETTSNVSDIERSIFGGYYYLAFAINEQFNFGEIRSDNTNGSGEPPFSDFDEFNSNLVLSSPIDNYWDNLYAAILNLNIAINGAEGDNTEEVSLLVGEAKFLRAYCYYNLVRSYGDVPINLQSSVEYDDFSILVRKPSEEVYELVFEDLNDAISRLRTSGSPNRPTVYTARALLAKVYMTLGNTSSAEPLLADVIQNSGASLLDSYADIFALDNELNDEILFAVQYEPNVGVPNQFQANFAVQGTDNVNYAEQSFYDAYEPGDLRRDISILSEGTRACIKYPLEDPSEVNDQGNDWIVMRLADIILLYAEALNENGSSANEVLPLLDPIRERAGLAILDPDTLNTQELVREAIKNERRFELAFENHRWYDLVRWGDAIETLDIPNANFLLFPIPQSEINATNGNITQNDGY